MWPFVDPSHWPSDDLQDLSQKVSNVVSKSKAGLKSGMISCKYVKGFYEHEETLRITFLEYIKGNFEAVSFFHIHCSCMVICEQNVSNFIFLRLWSLLVKYCLDVICAWSFYRLFTLPAAIDHAFHIWLSKHFIYSSLFPRPTKK